MKSMLCFVFVLCCTVSFSQLSFNWTDITLTKGACRTIIAGCVRFPGERGSCLDRNPEETSIDSLAYFLKKNSTLVVLLEVHSDTRGSGAANLRLTQEQGICMKKYLMEVHGIHSERIQTVGMGEGQPLYSDEEIRKAKTKEEKERLHGRNRRGVVKIVSVGNK